MVALMMIVGGFSSCGVGKQDELGDTIDSTQTATSNQNENADDQDPDEKEQEPPRVVVKQLLSTVDDMTFDNMRVAASNNNPVCFQQNVNDVIEGKMIKKIGIPVMKIADLTKDCMTEIHVVTNSLPATIVETYPLTIPANTYDSQTVQEWIYFDLNIRLENGQMLAFGKKDETIFWGYANTTVAATAATVQESRGCNIKIDTSNFAQLEHSLLFDIYFEEEETQMMKSLKGKYISLLGASTSTFYGFSNSSLYNSTIVNNAQHYPKNGYLTDVNETWWMKTINELDMRLCVNNSWSGSCVTTMVDGKEKAGCMDRATQLHNDTLGIEPDIIVLIIGGNDALRGYEIGSYRGVNDIYDENKKEYVGDCTKFGQAYATMVHKVKNRYSDADIYVCSMLHWDPKNHNKSLEPYNEMIQKIAEEFNVTYVDFYNGTKISPTTKDTYLFPDYVHPNQQGFAQMSDCVVTLLKKQYGES